MITIGRMPQNAKRFFKPVAAAVSEHVYDYFWRMTLALCLSHTGTIERLVELRRNVWQEEIKNVIKVSHDKNVIRRLEKLLAA